MNLAALEALWSRLTTLPTSFPLALFGAALALALGELIRRLGFGLLRRVTRRTETLLDDLLLRRLRLPSRLLLAAVSLLVLLRLRGDPVPSLRKLATLAALFSGAYMLIEALQLLLVRYWLGERKQVQIPAVVRHLGIIILYCASAFYIVSAVTGLDLLPLLATSTIVTVIVGLALQDTLGNLFAGFVMHVEKPFSIGDWILVDGVEGQVVYIGWRSTRLRSPSWDMVALPNSLIAKARVQNYYAPSKISARRVEFLVALSASPEAVERAARTALAATEGIRAEPRPFVLLLAMSAFPPFQRYAVKFWIDDFEASPVLESQLLKKLWHACRRAGIALPGVYDKIGFIPTLSGEEEPALAPVAREQVDPAAVAAALRMAPDDPALLVKDSGQRLSAVQRKKGSSQ